MFSNVFYLLLSKHISSKRSSFNSNLNVRLLPRSLGNLLDYDRWYDVYKFVCAFIFGREQGEHTKLSEIQLFTLINLLLSSSAHIRLYTNIESS